MSASAPSAGAVVGHLAPATTTAHEVLRGLELLVVVERDPALLAAIVPSLVKNRPHWMSPLSSAAIVSGPAASSALKCDGFATAAVVGAPPAAWSWWHRPSWVAPPAGRRRANRSWSRSRGPGHQCDADRDGGQLDQRCAHGVLPFGGGRGSAIVGGGG